jgi:hypothetical protein
MDIILGFDAFDAEIHKVPALLIEQQTRPSSFFAPPAGCFC